jgi:dihydrodipicolinate synthase/N-acetylneuraminate lyase
MSLTPAVAETLRQALATVVVVPVTPLLADGNPDWAAYTTLTRRLIDGGITVITPNGNTGEFYALSQAEARQVLETAAAACTGQDPKTEVLAMLDALRGNDFGEAMKIWEKARRFEELRLADASADNVSVVKEALAQLGLCRADVRPPSRLLPDPVKQEISAMLTWWGLA